ncbi:MAG: DUF2179 domain-containing protein [Planctomycetes bacterium]|nr:DUF2179 domain-containing protein [Planctomycetota bacterium]
MSSILSNIFSTELYTWIIIPLLIFVARIADVSFGTVRVIFVSRGLKYLAPVVGFFEILIWLMAIGQIMKNLSNPVCFIAYSGGFAMGNFVGMCIAEKLSLGFVMIRVITVKKASELVRQLRSAEYGVTSIDGHGSEGDVNIVFTIVPRSEVKSVVSLIKAFSPKAFYTLEEVGHVEKGFLPPKNTNGFTKSLNFFKPFRKSK